MSAPVQVGPSPSGGGPVPSLTDHEVRVLEFVALGHTHEQIASQLVMTPKGVTPTVNRAVKKLGARNAPHAVFLACGAGILQPGRRHGDHAGFAAHRYRGEEPCDACWEGERAYRRERRAARKANAE
ncbi:LuxR C-terminal-related transcriptional regulator [Streptomyces europaeiscabiei]|uniref:LuxR C-terminal-related transcriptional regulator n=1 Tax=Streptomyces europaeiscabiei TaxID=146819 RepID=UPI0038B4B4DD